MKPGLAALPMDVWADVFVYPWIRRQQLAQIVHRFKERDFAEKLQMFLHDPRCGKHILRYLYFRESRKRGKCDFNSRASLRASSNGRALEECEFPQPEMPENIRSFKRLSISYFDDRVLDFMAKIKSLLTNVFICTSLVGTPKKEKDLCILLDHLLPMVTSIRGIFCHNDCIELLNTHFPGTLESAKELKVKVPFVDPTYLPAYFDWLNAPQDYEQHGPRFLIIDDGVKDEIDIVGAVRQQFLADTTRSTFIIFLENNRTEEEFSIENAVTNEQLVVRNAKFKIPKARNYSQSRIRYVEIVRHPMGEDGKMRDWINGRAYYETIFGEEEDQTVPMIWIQCPNIGRITKRGKFAKIWMVTEEDGEPEPSTSAAKKWKKF